MLLDLQSIIINTDHVRSIHRDREQREGGERIVFTYTNGETRSVIGRMEDMQRLCGRLVAAPPGFTVCKAWVSGDREPTFDMLSVVAFRITDEHQDVLTPLTIEGEPSEPWALVDPLGKVIGTERWDSLDDFKASVRPGANR